MKIGEVIGEVNHLMPNAINNSVQINWLKRLDMQIVDEIINTHEKPDEYVEPDFDGYNVDTRLVVDDIHAELYVWYLKMKIALEQMESERYVLAQTNYNNMLITYRNYYNRKHMPLTKATPTYR